MGEFFRFLKFFSQNFFSQRVVIKVPGLDIKYLLCPELRWEWGGIRAEWENHLTTIIRSFAWNFKTDVFYCMIIFILVRGGTPYDLVIFPVCFGLLFTLPVSNYLYLTASNREFQYPGGCTLLALNLGF